MDSSDYCLQQLQTPGGGGHQACYDLECLQATATGDIVAAAAVVVVQRTDRDESCDRNTDREGYCWCVGRRYATLSCEQESSQSMSRTRSSRTDEEQLRLTAACYDCYYYRRAVSEVSMVSIAGAMMIATPVVAVLEDWSKESEQMSRWRRRVATDSMSCVGCCDGCSYQHENHIVPKKEHK